MAAPGDKQMVPNTATAATTSKTLGDVIVIIFNSDGRYVIPYSALALNECRTPVEILKRQEFSKSKVSLLG